MRTFESQGFLRRRQGLGTFVEKPTRVIETGLEVLESIETLGKKIGLNVTMGALDIKHALADEMQAEKLHLRVGAPILQVKRVIITDHAPVAYLIDILPDHVITLKTIEDQFTGSMLDLLESVCESTFVGIQNRDQCSPCTFGSGKSPGHPARRYLAAVVGCAV